MIKVMAIYRDNRQLAEIRTDGRRYEVFDDLTNGLAEKIGRGDYARLVRRLASSSYLTLQAKRDSVPGVLRYLLDSGDVVEVTTDGRTALQNGQMLDEAAKNQLMAAIASGQVTVVQKQNISKPTPINLSLRSPERVLDVTGEDRVNLYRECNEAAQKVLEQYSGGSHNYDERIENMDLDGHEWPERIRNMAYFLKHGKFKGE